MSTTGQEAVQSFGELPSAKSCQPIDGASKKATLNPNVNLQPEATYVATVTTEAKDNTGNSLDQNAATAGNQQKTWKFTVS